MSTKYILHGGNAQDANEHNDVFFREILSNYDHEVRVLLVHFAAIPEKSDIYKERHIAQFERVSNGKTVMYEVATHDAFVEQVGNADVVYLSGSSGGTVRLLDALAAYSNLATLFNGKTVAGESAGANVLSSYCYSRSSGVVKGLGLVPVRLIAHYQNGDEQVFDDVDDALERVFLKNYELKVFDL